MSAQDIGVVIDFILWKYQAILRVRVRGLPLFILFW